MLQGKPHCYINLCSLCKTAEPTQPPSFPKPLIEVGGGLSQACWPRFVILSYGSLKQKDFRFKTSLGNLVRHGSSKMKKNWKCSSWNMVASHAWCAWVKSLVCTLVCTPAPALLHLHKQMVIQLRLPIHRDVIFTLMTRPVTVHPKTCLADISE